MFLLTLIVNVPADGCPYGSRPRGVTWQRMNSALICLYVSGTNLIGPSMLAQLHEGARSTDGLPTGAMRAPVELCILLFDENVVSSNSWVRQQRSSQMWSFQTPA